MFTNLFFSAFAALSLSSTIVNARVVPRDVIVPPVLYPTNGTQWFVGQRHNVTWDTSVVPAGSPNTGMILLGFLDDSGDLDEHLDVDHPLAQGFLLSQGRVEVTVPDVTPLDTYIVVLFGDSGDKSGEFRISNMSISSSSPSTSTGTDTAAPTDTDTDTAAPTSTDTSSENDSSASPSDTDVLTPTPSGTVTSPMTLLPGGSAASTPIAAGGAPSTPADSSTASTPGASSTVSSPTAVSSTSSSRSGSASVTTSPVTQTTTSAQGNAGSRLRFNFDLWSLMAVVLGAFML